MMLRHLLAAGILASSVILPLSAHAYVSPEDMLDEGDYDTYFYTPPPSKRTVQTRVQEQQERSAERREAELNAVMPQPEEEEDLKGAAEEEPEQTELDKLIEAIKLLQGDGHGSAPDNGTDDGWDTDYSGMTTEELREQRLLERIRQQQLLNDRQASYGAAVAASQETLRSGAPLADTGPAAVLTAIAVIGAIGETWRRVRNSEKNI